MRKGTGGLFTEEDFAKYKIEIFKPHRKNSGKIVIMTRKISKSNLGTKLGIRQSTKVSDTQKGGKLRTR